MNLTIRHHIFSAVILFIACTTIEPHTQASSQGMITVRGAVYEPDCSKTHTGRLITYTCWRGGKLLSSNWNVNNRANKLPSGIATTSVRWIKHQQQGIVTINYN